MKPNNKKSTVNKATAKKAKNFNFSRKQLTIAGVLGVLVLAGAGYWAYSMFSIDDANAGSCTSITYKSGARATCVKYAQQMLGIKADAVYGKGTVNAVKAFQSRNGIAADGKLGQNTWSKLCASSSNVAARQGAGCPAAFAPGNGTRVKGGSF